MKLFQWIEINFAPLRLTGFANFNRGGTGRASLLTTIKIKPSELNSFKKCPNSQTPHHHNVIPLSLSAAPPGLQESTVPFISQDMI